MQIHVGWLKRDDYADGGCWALFAKNGHLVAEMATKGRSKRTYDTALALSVGYSDLQEREAKLAA